MLFLSDKVEQAWGKTLFSLQLLSRVYTSWNPLEWSLGLPVLEPMPQKINLGLNNLVKWKEMKCVNERIMSLPFALTKFYFVKSIVYVLGKRLRRRIVWLIWKSVIELGRYLNWRLRAIMSLRKIIDGKFALHPYHQSSPHTVLNRSIKGWKTTGDSKNEPVTGEQGLL